MKTYKIVRMFMDREKDNEVIKTGLTLDEAQEHCRCKETSSRTCTNPISQQITDTYGPWFDGYQEE